MISRVWPKLGYTGAELSASLTYTFSTSMAHIAAIDLALAIARNLFPIAKDDADFNSPLSFVATLPARGMETILVRETLALLILKEMSAPDNKDEFNFIFGRVEFVMGCADEGLFRSRVLLGFFNACKDLNLETFASGCQIEALKRGCAKPPRRSGQFHWSDTLVGHDVEDWMAWLFQEEE